MHTNKEKTEYLDIQKKTYSESIFLFKNIV